MRGTQLVIFTSVLSSLFRVPAAHIAPQNLVELRELFLRENFLTTIPTYIGRLRHLAKLDVSANKLSARRRRGPTISRPPLEHALTTDAHSRFPPPQTALPHTQAAAAA